MGTGGRRSERLHAGRGQISISGALLHLGDAQPFICNRTQSDAIGRNQTQSDAIKGALLHLGDAQRHKVSIRMPPAEKVSHARMPDTVVKGARDGLALTSPGCREQQACLGLDTPHQNP